MQARFRVEPTDKKDYYRVEIHYQEDHDNLVYGQEYVHEKNLDNFIADFKFENGPYEMIQILPRGEKVVA